MRPADLAVAGGPWLLLPDRLQTLAGLSAEQAQSYAAIGAARLAGEQQPYELGPDGVAVLTIRGVLLKPVGLFQQILAALFGGVSTPALTAAVRRAGDDAAVRELRLVIDSPGGEAGGVCELARAVRDVATRKPVTAAVEYAASAAYWIASATRRIVATGPTAQIGSIGAYAVVVDESAAAAAEGATVHVVSSAPPLKGAGVPGSKVTGPQLDAVQRRIDDLAAVFVAEVAEGRHVPVGKVQQWATGEVWIASRALALGLIDEVAADGAQGGGMGMSAEQTSNERAADLMKSGRAKTHAAALQQVWAADPALWDRYEAEKASRPAPAPAQTPPPAPQSAWSIATERASDLQKAGRARTLAEAMSAVWSADPALWERYEAERGNGPAAA